MAHEPLDGVPEFLRAAGHPLRWRLLGELATSDRNVRDLTERVRVPQNLVSYHLGQLRSARLISGRRSSADGRDTYYRLDLARCGALLAAAGDTLHPALRLAMPQPPAASAVRAGASVLFLCTGNSSRSQMAEAFLRHQSRFAVHTGSAGSHPKAVHPHAVAAMAEHGIDLAGARPKHFDTYADETFSHVITLCDRVREVCPEFGGRPPQAHWSIPDPARDPAGYPAFQRVAAELSERVGFLLHTLAIPLPPLEAP
ncbi:ArsR family transcriptional regulator [Catellatospora chokoriensis]|uniref:ArsR family transcriptional regulator n=1 Tax=Catellatospora chokoriensis TaxID=310353 RepID=A0A8J3K3U8_9ACTN|nr:MarR family transcriptional regulator [Catellatospora chokoriensis]GIF92393.1 ArsR family transcriptional regulator [Catellatospora chokoriensis]